MKGGGANYGIVTEWEFEVAPAPTLVISGVMDWPLSEDNLADVLLAVDAWKPWNLPDSYARAGMGAGGGGIDGYVDYFWYEEDGPPPDIGALLRDAFSPTKTKPTISVSNMTYLEYILSKRITNLYGVPASDWTLANISTVEAVLDAELSGRKVGMGAWLSGRKVNVPASTH